MLTFEQRNVFSSSFYHKRMLCLSWLKLEVPTEKFENDFSVKWLFHNACSSMTCLLFVQQLKSGRSNYIAICHCIYLHITGVNGKGKVTLFKIGSFVCL